MIVRVLLLLVIVPACATPAQTASQCPWLSSGTAAKILGGNISLEAHADGNDDGSCRFVRNDGGKAESIDILIGKKDTHPCPAESASVRSLGNEAVQCRRLDPDNQQIDIIAGRMRDVYFAVTMTGLPDAARQIPADPHLSDPFGASLLERVAEQVVGNLY